LALDKGRTGTSGDSITRSRAGDRVCSCQRPTSLRRTTRCVTGESRCTVSNSAPLKFPLARPCSAPCRWRPSRHRNVRALV